MSHVCLYQSSVFLLVILTVFSNISQMSAAKLISTEFEVFGVVQGVFFRKYTQNEASKLGLKGWCRNTDAGTVKGVMEGDSNKIAEMKRWLQFTGSPSSRIDKAVFTNEKEIESLTYDTFSVKR